MSQLILDLLKKGIRADTDPASNQYVPGYKKQVHMVLCLESLKILQSNHNKLFKTFISKICKYKRGQKYENINIFFPFAKHLRC